MSRVMVRYRLKPDRVEENERLVRAVYAELARANPSGIRYRTIRLADGVSFLHFYDNDRADGVNPLAELAAFKAFQEAIRDRCDEPPVPVEVFEIGAFGFEPAAGSSR